jgi:hypothetical protein
VICSKRETSELESEKLESSALLRPTLSIIPPCRIRTVELNYMSPRNPVQYSVYIMSSTLRSRERDICNRNNRLPGGKEYVVVIVKENTIPACECI